MPQLRFNIADTDIAVDAPHEVLSVVDRMLADVDRNWRQMLEPLHVLVSFDSALWLISGQSPSSRKALGGRTALPQVAGAIVAAILAEITYRRNVEVWRAAVVERDQRALVLIGEDWESCVTLTAHLHTRGWRILGGDYALISVDGLVVSAFKKVLHANSSCVGSFPAWYRRAIEASPWYASSESIAFYAIDPQLSVGALPWGESANLAAVLKIDGKFAAHPSLHKIDNVSFAGSLRMADLERAGIEISGLVVGDFVETCDFVERWFAESHFVATPSSVA